RPSCRTLSGSSNLDATATSDVYTLSLHDALPISPFSADDVKFSIDRAMAEGSVNPQKGLYSAIDTVEVVDPATVVITLKHPQGRSEEHTSELQSGNLVCRLLPEKKQHTNGVLASV